MVDAHRRERKKWTRIGRRLEGGDVHLHKARLDGNWDGQDAEDEVGCGQVPQEDVCHCAVVGTTAPRGLRSLQLAVSLPSQQEAGDQ